MRKRSFIMLSGVLLVVGGCSSNLLNPTPAPQSAEAFCASLPEAGFGHLFFCGTAQSNLQGGLPNGNLGYCMTADTGSIGLVGYSATTYTGGAFPVTDFSTSQNECAQLNTGGVTQCGSIIRCTRQ
jgi:hypothetical protein